MCGSHLILHMFGGLTAVTEGAHHLRMKQIRLNKAIGSLIPKRIAEITNTYLVNIDFIIWLARNNSAKRNVAHALMKSSDQPAQRHQLKARPVSSKKPRILGNPSLVTLYSERAHINSRADLRLRRALGPVYIVF